MEPDCELSYSPLVKCGGKAYGKHDGKHLCLHHLVSVKQREDCVICFSSMSSEHSILLTCGHMFHVECLSCCRLSECPLCRRQLVPEEAIATVGKKYIDSIAVKLYSLPKQSIKTAILCINIVLKLCSFAPSEVYEILRIFDV